jgi:hypothetical protein
MKKINFRVFLMNILIPLLNLKNLEAVWAIKSELEITGQPNLLHYIGKKHVSGENTEDHI